MTVMSAPGYGRIRVWPALALVLGMACGRTDLIPSEGQADGPVPEAPTDNRPPLDLPNPDRPADKPAPEVPPPDKPIPDKPPDTGPGAGVGDPCTKAADCGADPEVRCIGASSIGCGSGFCTRSCAGGAPCPAGSICKMLPWLDDAGKPATLDLCFVSCSGGGCPAAGATYCDAERGICGSGGFLFNLGSLGARKPDGSTCASSPPAPAATLFGKNRGASDPTDKFVSEPHIALDPVDPKLVYVAYNSSAGSTVSVSEDAGGSWSHQRIAPDVDPADLGDPVLAVSPVTRALHHIYITRLTSTCTPGMAYPGKNELHIIRSDDRGGSWSKPVRVNAPEYTSEKFLVDKPWMTIGPGGAIHVGYLPYPTAGGGTFDIVVATSHDGGETFASVTASDVARAAGRQLVGLATDGKGRLYVVWWETGPGPGGDVWLTRSDDGGGSFLHPNVLVTSSSDVEFDDPQVAVSADGARVWVAWGSVVPGGELDAEDVQATLSIDGGDTFAPPVKVNEDASCATHWHPAATVDDAGNLWLVYYDARWGDGRVRWARVEAEGALPKVAALGWVTDAAASFTTSRIRFFLGDYIGLAYSSGQLWAAWGDLRDVAGGGGRRIYVAGAAIP